jgi:regulator of protease activity HflC (stomatin/prohibitin superfamily)
VLEFDAIPTVAAAGGTLVGLMLSRLDKLFELIEKAWDRAKPFEEVKQYEAGVMLRLGKYARTLGPGLHFKWPFVEMMMSANTATTTLRSGNQSLTTADGINVVVASVLKYHISDAKVYLIEVWDAIDAMTDILAGSTAEVIQSRKYEECTFEDVRKEIEKTTRREARRWGIEVERVTITDFGKLRSIRLLQDNASLSLT